MIEDRRDAMAAALATVAELEGRAHAYPPEALAAPCGWVDTVTVTRGGNLRSLALRATIVLVADGKAIRARRRLDAAHAAAWLALNRAGFTPESAESDVIEDGGRYPAIRLVVSGTTTCLP